MPADVHDPLPGRLEKAERSLETGFPGYLDLVRSSARRRALADPEGTDLAAALVAVDELSLIDLDVPTASRIPLARYVKQAVKSLIAWYLGYFGRQITALGQSVAHLGTILVGRADRLENRVEAAESTLAELAGRVERLEEAGRAPSR
jgi:hypothetical protein